MTARPNLHRVAQALAVGLAGLALAVPASNAGPIGPWGWPHDTRLDEVPAVTPVRMDSLTEEQLLAARGLGAPRPASHAATPAADPDADPLAIAGGTAVALVVIGGAFAARRRVRVTA